MLTLVTSLMPISSSEGVTVLILDVEVVDAVVDKIPFAIVVVAVILVAFESLDSEDIASVDDLVVPFVVVSTVVDLVVFLVLVEIVVGFVVRLVVDLSVVDVD